MAIPDKRITVYPSVDAINVLGTTAPALNAAIDRYAILSRLFKAPEKTQDAVWAIVKQMLDATGVG
jgi:hypothetical protein